MIDLNEFGELISKQEWISSKGKIENFIYLGTNKTYSGDKYVIIDGEDKGDGRYNCLIYIPEETNEAIGNINISDISTLSKILSISDEIKNDTINVVYTYQNAKEKGIDTYKVKLNSSVELELDKDVTVVTDKKYFVKEIHQDQKEIHYELHDYGFVCTEADESKTYFLNDVKSCVPESNSIILTDIITNPDIATSIPNLTNLPRFTSYHYDKDLKFLSYFTYDEYGILKDGTDCLYEAYCFDEYDNPIFISSLHPLYFDNFDTGLVPGKNKFCVEQIDRALDSDIIIYSKEVYDIKDPDKIKELVELIKESKLKNEPCIAPIE